MIHWHEGKTICENEDCKVYRCDKCFRFFGLTNDGQLPIHRTIASDMIDMVNCDGTPTTVE